MPIQFSTHHGEDGHAGVSVFADGRIAAADDSHPNFKTIVGMLHAAQTDPTISADDVFDLFDVAATIEKKFQRLTDRVTVENGKVLVDHDPVHGVLEDQILRFVDEGLDFDALVNFYDRLLNNPLGDVREGLFRWIQGRDQDARRGLVTITEDGMLLGYKAVGRQAPQWREGTEDVYVPSRASNGGDRVNDVVVPQGKFIEQRPGDTVEMPRSVVLHEPSRECGVGLHIGTWDYARTFMTSSGVGGHHAGQTVMLVEFDPRDIVSLPDSNSAFKLRVCRYTVVEPVTEPLDVPVYQRPVELVFEDKTPVIAADDFGDDFDSAGEDPEEFDSEDVSFGEDYNDSKADPDDFVPGDRVLDEDGDHGTVVKGLHGVLYVQYDEEGNGMPRLDEAIEEIGLVKESGIRPNPDKDGNDLEVGDVVEDQDGDEGTVTGFDNDGDPKIDYTGHGDSSLDGVQGSSYANEVRKIHGKGGPTSQAAKGNGRNPNQDDKGRFSSGRPGSQRDSSTGRFA